ncbi:MAG: hypothetical protein ABSG91_14515 [Syntrophobacteraceae bacterium]
MEETVAEIGAAFLCPDLGLTPDYDEAHAPCPAGPREGGGPREASQADKPPYRRNLGGL